MFDLKGRTALVTGAGSGIGRAIAVSLAGRGCNLALADVNEGGLAQTAQPLAGTVRVTSHLLDVTDREAVVAFPATVTAAHGGLDILVNNAGVAIAGTFAQVSEADFEWLIDVNFWGVVRMTRAFLPMLRSAPEARIVNLSSLYGLVAPPGQTAYSASKFAVRGFSQALAHEMEGGTVGVTVVHPGGVATSIADSARATAALSTEELERGRRIANSLLTMPPARAGEIIVRGIEQRRRRVIVGTDAKIASLIERFMPVSYWGILRRLKRENM